MLLENKGLNIDNFFVPPFTVDKGEIVTVCLFGGSHFFDLETKLADILTGKVKNDNINVSGQFHFVKNTQTFSDIPYIIFDLVGQDLNMATQTYETVRQHVKQGGAAIFLDNFPDSNFDRTRYVEIKKIT
jgi:hypothetical protein